MQPQGTSPVAGASRATVAVSLAVAAVIVFVIAMMVAQETNEWLWPLAGLLGGAGAFAGWRAGGPRPQGKALAAVVLGGTVFLVILGWIVWAASTGNF